MKVVLLWLGVIAIAATMLVAVNYQSRDPDSALYARLAADLAVRPVSKWIAPEWNGAWNSQGLFREHPVGILLPSAVAIRLGFPPRQAAYAINMLYQAAALLLIVAVARFGMRDADARALGWVLQLLPVSFVYRIRGNQEHPLLVCFLALIYASHRSRSNPIWIALMVMAFCWLALIKGAFAMFALIAAALWIAIVPPDKDGASWRAWLGLGIAGLAAIGLFAIYEAAYVRTTGESFLAFYRNTRLGESMDLSDPRIVPHTLRNIVWYFVRLVWFAAPWSLVALVVWVALIASARHGFASFQRPDVRAAMWGLVTTMMFVVVLSPANVRAERFIFPMYFVAGALGFATASLRWPFIARVAMRTAAWWWLPAATWMLLLLASVGSKLLR